MAVKKAVAVVAGAGLIGIFAAGTAQAAPAARCSSSGTTTTCYQVISTAKSSFVALTTDAVINNTAREADFTCMVEAKKAYEASVSATVGASVKLGIIADMNASTTATVVSKVETTVGSSIKIPVPAHTTTYCDRGTYTYRGTVRKTGSNGQSQIPTTTFTATAPAVLTWRLRDG